jgi:hypothetical protein
MVGRPGKFQPRFTAGELDPLVWQNTDLGLYSKGASRMENVEPIPQGGFRLTKRLRKRGRIRNALTEISLAAAVLTAPLGGTTANAIDAGANTLFTTGALGAGGTVFVATLGAPVPLSIVDVAGFLCSAGIGVLGVDISPDGATWTRLDSAVALRTSARTRRFALPAGITASTKALRIVVSGLGGTATFTLDRVRAFVESNAASSTKRVRPFTRSISQAYDFVFTDGNIEVFDANLAGAGGRVASIATPWSGQQIVDLVGAQQLDTGLYFHQDVQPRRILHQGSASEWNIDLAPFTGIPNYDFGDTVYTNGFPATWLLHPFNIAAGNHYTLTVTGEETIAITFHGTYTEGAAPDANTAANKADILNAILALPNVKSGITVEYVGPGNVVTSSDGVAITSKGFGYLVVFGGPGNAGDGWAVTAKVVDNSSAAITSAHTDVGVVGGEAIMSAARGWPSCGAFYQSRFIVGGFKGVPNSFLASLEGDYYNIDTRLTGSAAPILVPLNTDGAETVTRIHVARTLVIFTDEAEYWLEGNAITATSTPSVINASRNGIAPGIAPVEAEATIYPHVSRGTLYEFKFDYGVQNYASANLSVTSSGDAAADTASSAIAAPVVATSAGIVAGLIDMALRKVTAGSSTNQLIGVKDDGTGFICELLREQNVTAFARYTTDGAIRAVDVNGRYDVNMIVDRVVGAQVVSFLERQEAGLILDCAEDRAVLAGATSIAGLTDLEGATVYAIVDQFVQGPFTVSGGTINLGFAALANGNATIGRWSRPVVKTLRQPRDVAPRTVVERPCRVHTARAKVVNTSSIAIGANGKPAKDIALRTLADPTDVSLLAAPKTMTVPAIGLPGWSDDGIVEITQAHPGMLTVTGVVVEVDL